jgi:hypothetical protein
MMVMVVWMVEKVMIVAGVVSQRSVCHFDPNVAAGYP